MCTICRDNQTQDVDRALLAGATLAFLNQKYGFSISALQRHKKHLFEKIGRAQTRLRDHLRQNCLFKLTLVLEIAMHTARAATGEGNAKIALQATREVTRIINLLTKQDFELDPEMVYCLLRSHEWVGYHGLLPADSEVIPKTRRTMAENLFTPCPEPESNQDLDPAPTPKTIYRKRKPGNGTREHPWKTGGKLPGKTTLLKVINRENQEDSVSIRDTEKRSESSNPGAVGPNNPPVNHSSDPAPTAPLETRSPKLETLFQKLRRKWKKRGKYRER